MVEMRTFDRLTWSFCTTSSKPATSALAHTQKKRCLAKQKTNPFHNRTEYITTPSSILIPLFTTAHFPRGLDANLLCQKGPNCPEHLSPIHQEGTSSLSIFPEGVAVVWFCTFLVSLCQSSGLCSNTCPCHQGLRESRLTPNLLSGNV